MDWTGDDSLYAIFQTWKLKCENIFESELANMPKKENVRFFSDGHVT